MKCKRLLLMLLVALLAPWVANAQQTVTATCYPPTETYATGYTDGTDKTSGQLHVESAGGDRGWMKFDVSAIPDGATINSITLKFYCISGSNPYVNLTAAGELDPATASASELFSAIGTPSPNYYTSNYISGLSSAGWKTFGLSSNAISNLQDNGLTNDYFTVGFYAYETYSYYFNAYGYDEADYMPYIEVTYASTEPYVELSPTTAKIQPGATETLTATPGNITGTPTYSYSSSNTSVATVSGSGTTATVTGVAVGTATITVTMNYEGANYTATSEITVSNEITVSIGSGTSTFIYLPTHTNYKYSYSQQIYTAAEIGEPGTITSVSFKGASVRTRTLDVYMVNTDKASFSSTSDFIAVSEADRVFSGSVSFVANDWTTITLTGDGFDYTGENLAIIVDDNTGSDPGSTYWSTFTASSNQGLYYYQDASNINPSSPTSASGKNCTTSKNQIILSIIPSSTPKPCNLIVSNITPTSATLSWQAPASATPTSYSYRYNNDINWTNWESTSNLSVDLNLQSSTHYTFQVKAVYDGVGESNPIETEFRTLDACAFPTNLLAYTAPGEGTKATLSWRKGYDETAWVLQYATNNTFTEDLVELTSGFIPQTDPGLENVVVAVLNGLTPEQTYYARVKADCGSGSTSVWSNVETFTPSNYVDYTYGANASTTNSYIPFYGYYANDERTISQYIIPATELADVAGGTIRSLTYYTNSTPDWGTATVKVYVKEVNRTTFASSSASEVEDWENMTQVYNGSLTVSGGQMTITFDNTYLYGGGNLMIGIKMDQTGTSAGVYWTSVQGSSSNYNGIYGYYYSYWEEMSYSRSYYYPKTTINYKPTPYKYPVIDEDNCTFETTSAHIAWTVTGATPTGYQYQYKSASATEWPNAWTPVTTAYADLSDLAPGSFYDFRVKALYDGGNESVVVDYSFFTECDVITAFPWKETFESYPANSSSGYDETYKFDHPCWVNEHLVDGTGSSGSMTLFQVCSYTQNGNSTHKLQLPDMKAGTVTGLRLPEMTLASGTDYQFVLDINRNTDSKPTEGIRVFVSTNGELEGATELCFISRDYTVASAPYIPAEEASGWYTYELPLGIQGTCYIILRGESQYGSATYMDNLTVEQIPTCARPSELAYSDVTNHSATIEWTAGDAEQTLWQIAYSKTDFDPNTANFDVTTVTTIDATAHPFTLDKILDAASTYYVYVRANCGTATESDYGPWSRKGISFTTQVATPAPSNFVASNPASAKVDLVWNAGGGDFESWELYYVASETAPEAPTATTTATVSNITTLPTTEAPYVLEGLDPVTKYFAWIRAKHVWDNETTYSDWVALTSSYFETLDACPTPTDLVATNLTSVSADLSWVGSDDVTEGYTVEYGEEGTYSLNETVDFSGLTPVNYNATGGELPEGWYSYNTSTSGFAPRVSSSSNYSYISGLTDNFLLMTTNAYSATDPSANQYAYAIMPQYSNLGSVSFDYQYENISYGTLTVGYVTNNEGYTTYQVLETPTKASGKQTWSLTATHIATINNANGYVAFRYESGNGTFYSVGIDNVTIKGGTYTPGATQTVPSEGTSITISNLTPNKTYIVKVKSNCTSGEYCEPISFTTLAEGNMVFTNATNDGKWGTAGNWVPAQMPVLTDEVILRANATIENGCVAEAKKITFSGTPTPTLTIADGGQLKHNNSSTITATVKKNVTGYGANNVNTNNGYVLLAPPFGKYIYQNNSDGTGLRNGTYDLYSWARTTALEWTNYGSSNSSYLYMSRGTGYLYANQEDTEITFAGSIYGSGSSYSASVSYTAPTAGTTEFSDFNLIGNPFVCDAYLVDAATDGNALAFYKMNADGNDFEPTTGTAIAPMEGVFYQATEAGNVYFTREMPATSTQPGTLNISLAQVVATRGAKGSTDNAIIRFGEGNTLGKFSFNENSAKVYIPQNGKDYAVVNAGNVGEMPVNFKANENGTYTLSFTNEEVTFSYLHLIDNMTGADVDLLATPSYTFDARYTDYASRFRLVFATGSSANGENFGFVNASGNLSIFGIEGTATLQVIDVTGRMLSSETFSGSYEKRLNAAPGVYMLRLIQGNDVKVQKMVVR